MKLVKTFYIVLIQALLVLMLSTNAHAREQIQEVDEELRAFLKASISEADSFEDRFDAEVWLISNTPSISKYIKNRQEQLKILRLVHREATRVGIQPGLVLALIQIESAFDPYAVSVVGAQGMMQIMPFWKKEIGRDQDNLIDIETNLRYGCTILKHYVNKEKGQLAGALARYNGSYGKFWYPEKVLVAWERYWRH